MSAWARVRVMSVALAAALLPRLAAAGDWSNLDEAHYVAGRQCSAGYLVGKVVLVCRDVKLSKRMEEIWTSFKTKPFVLLGTFPKAPKLVSFPVYAGADYSEATASKPLYLVDALGKVRYVGADERRATELLVTFLTDLESPKSEEEWAAFLAFEFDNLPGHAYVRYLDFKKKFPQAAKAHEKRFAELAKTPDIKKLAELIRFAKAVKDSRELDPKKAKVVRTRLVAKIKEMSAKSAALKDAEDPRVVQEAKNALAELAWAKATL